jgi:hypothetical protein
MTNSKPEFRQCFWGHWVRVGADPSLRWTDFALCPECLARRIEARAQLGEPVDYLVDALRTAGSTPALES